ncbi:Hypothetical predicted protein [Mytilus galloprovincialis]|uniref:Uncharacterized protein n=1 Tax=Mytilus galloprovincialis TaxID=29158 RepID=A0A8B6H4L7_MYTGA|nr:Hypothetical predicted protein [Mytilus galloprovincialis]
MDTVKNRSGQKLLELCKGNDLFIVNGRIGDDKHESGKLTCKNTSVIDYCICTYDFLKFVSNFKVKEFSRLYSDVHSPITTTLHMNEFTVVNDQIDNTCDSSVSCRVKKWDVSKKTSYVDNIDKEKLQVLYTDLEETLSDNLDKDKVNSFFSKLSNLFIESAKNTFGSRKDTQKRKSTNKKPKGDKPWFNEECRFERQNYRKLKRKLKFRKTDTLKREVSEAEKRYKNTLDANSKKYRKQMRSKLKYMKTSDPKEYWNLLNRGKQKKQPNLPLEDLFDFFKN